MEASDRAQRFDFDPSVPQAARIYDAWLGGKDHYGVDRETADRVVELRPQVITAARANRRFLGRAVRYMARRHGISQFLDIGCGLPARDNTHQIAQRIDPRARVVYVDSDPVVMAHARALLTSGPDGCCDYIHADLRDTGWILRRAAQALDLTRPVAVLLLAVLHFIPDADDPAEIVAMLARALAGGSCVAITHLTGDFAPDAVGDAADAYNNAVPTPVIARTHAQVTELFAGLPLVAPGVVPVTEWRPDVIARKVVDLYGGVARTAVRRR
jgi:O-methyltransferase involved in polyketide biosynthesis